MSKVDFEKLGMGILIACFGVGYVITDISDAKRAEACDQRGGAIQKVKDEWFAPKACLVVRSK